MDDVYHRVDEVSNVQPVTDFPTQPDAGISHPNPTAGGPFLAHVPVTLGLGHQDDDYEETQAQVEPLGFNKVSVTAAGLLLAFVGQILIWVRDALVGTDSQIASGACEEGMQQGTRKQLGMYALLLVFISAANFASARLRRQDYIWISAAVAFSVLDVNICETHWLVRCTPGSSTKESDANIVKAGYIMLLVGCLLTFAAFPFRMPSAPPLKFGLVEAGIGVFVVVVLITGSALLWSTGHPCAHGLGGGGFGGVQAKVPKYPIYVGRAMYLALWHGLSIFSGYEDGLELSFIYAAISIADYQPFGPRCNWGECKAGVSLVFVGLIIIVVTRIVGAHMRRTSAGNSRGTHMSCGRPRAAAALLAVVFSCAGGVAVWVTKDSELGTGRVGAQEAWDVVSLVLATIMGVACLTTDLMVYGVVSVSLTFSVMNRALGADVSNSFIFGGCPSAWTETTGIYQHAAAGIRAGYILIFTALGLTLSSLFDPAKVMGQVMDLSSSMTAAMLHDERKVAMVVVSVLVLCVAFLWSDDKYYGQLGFTAVVYFLSACSGPNGRHQYKEGLNFVYFTALLQFPAITPFTTCESKDSANRLVLVPCLMGLLVIAFQHITRRGFAAVTSGQKPDVSYGDAVATPGGVAMVH
eukprot:Hpha_TRINITY_DN16241_c7_g8::TRINITY_DN16241_c7_g8_i1::g.12279::m.12279